MQTTIHGYNPETQKVDVTFEHLGVVHHRQINAVLTDDGEYDETATEVRIAEHRNTAQYRIERGILRNVDPQPVPPPLADEPPAEAPAEDEDDL